MRGIPGATSLAIAVLGAGAVLLATSWGVGLAPDSSAYVGAARSFANGDGLYVPAGDGTSPLVRFPPLYPLALGLMAWLGLDPLTGARWLNAGLCAGTALLVALALGRRAERLPWLPPLGALLAVSILDLQAVHAKALSEPLFLGLGTAALLLLAHHLERPRAGLLLASALCAALALCTRYAGGAHALTGVLALLLFGRGPGRRRLGEALAFGALSAAPLSAWLARNWWVGGSLTGRDLRWHAVPRGRLLEGAETLAGWFALDGLPGSLIGGAVLAALALAGLRALRARDGPAPGLRPRVLGLFVLVYPSLLLVSGSAFDAHTRLNARILSPILPPLLILVLDGIVGPSAPRPGRPVGAAALALALAFAGVHAQRTARWLADQRDHGVEGFGSRAWRESKLIAEVKALPADTTLYTNGPDPIYLLTGRRARWIPAVWDPVRGSQRDEAPLRLARLELERELRRGRAVVVWFDRLGWRNRYLPRKPALVDYLSLRPVFEAGDGAIFVASRSRAQPPLAE